MAAAEPSLSGAGPPALEDSIPAAAATAAPAPSQPQPQQPSEAAGVAAPAPVALPPPPAPSPLPSPPSSPSPSSLPPPSRAPLAHETSLVQDVFVVDDAESATWAVKVLREAAGTDSKFTVEKREPRIKDTTRYFGCDTEVAFIEVKEQSPVGHGAVICWSIYGGPDINFNRDPTGPHQDRLWVDCWNEVALGEDGRPVMEYGKVLLKPHRPIIEAFKAFFEDDSIKKVWHNYGFDRHVLSNMGIECEGFGADTLHMARLLDASRRGTKTYGLESLSSDPDIMQYIKPPPVQTSRREGLKKPAVKQLELSQQRLDGSSPAQAQSQQEQPPAGAAGGDSGSRGKTSMKKLFGAPKKKADGTPGKLIELPPIQELHTDALYRDKWIDYSALDAKATWELREALYRALTTWDWFIDDHLSGNLGYKPRRRDPLHFNKRHPDTRTLYDFYRECWVTFGKILTDMEKRGITVDREHLRAAEVQAIEDRGRNIEIFKTWAAMRVPDAKYMNVSSGSQIRQLFYPEYAGTISRPRKEPVDEFGNPLPPAPVEPEPAPEASSSAGEGEDAGDAPKAKPKRAVAKKKVVEPVPHLCRVFKVPVPTPEYEAELAAGVKRPKKNRDIMLYGIWGKGEPGRVLPGELTATGAAPVSILMLKTLAGKPGAARKALTALEAADAEEARVQSVLIAGASAVPILDDEFDMMHAEDEEDSEVSGSSGVERVCAGDEDGEDEGSGAAAGVELLPGMQELESEARASGFGKLYAALGSTHGKRAGLEACVAVEALCEVNAIDKLLSGFIIPLQRDDISTTDAQGRSRVHCSLNINTETGRLSARRPNLQNQPALEKDRYKVRKAFTSDKTSDHTLIVADYGQLELRILAHMANCQSMIRAFVLGGDFHSRTAYGMYDYIQEAVRTGECYLEWEGVGEPNKPLLKDKYASERRKAKILNFSIAYGKTAHGLAKDFNTSLQEAEETVEKWYSDRAEVRNWQTKTKEWARNDAVTYTVPFVSTFLGRNRPLPDLAPGTDRRKRGHAERAAINTPIQGSAADVAAAAMVAICECPELKQLGWHLLMQVHDEVIMEGPRGPVSDAHPKGEIAERARELVVQHMANPWAAEMERAIKDGKRGPVVYTRDPIIKENGRVLASPVEPLLVELSTSSDIADTWYEAK
ncbi:hypothetical protein FOA52_011565 [Chlamydomonas sp. UWO 241]|nr:hypothetical protein FOA52_011565 [Chlamydomonas sp. UWO 241]